MGSGRVLSRRSALKWLAFACGAQALGACTALRGATESGRGARRRLAPVRVSAERVIRQVVGLRPFRRSGFLVRADPLNDKLLVHNYGHGGGGVSLSWGTADLAVELALTSLQRQAAVVGCGAVGLATARLLQDRGFSVTIYARDLPPNTTSNVAGAQWSPFSVADPGRRTPEFETLFARAVRISHRYFQDLVGEHYGVRWIENYVVTTSPEPAELYSGQFRNLYPAVRSLTGDEHPFDSPYAHRF